MFPLPEFTSTLSNTSSNIPEEDLKLIQANEKTLYDEILEYRRSVIHQFLGLFNSCASTLNNIDDKFSFYSDMYGHVDGTFRDLVTSKIANIFKSDVRSDILDKNLSREDRGKGLLGGNDRLGSVLGNAQKRRDLIKKAIVPPRRTGYERRGN